MKGMNRRRFLQVAGAGSIAVASGTAAAVPLLRAAPGLAASSHQGTLSFRAVTGLPTKTLPTYASYVLEGHVNLTRDIEAFFAQKYGTSSCRFQRLVPQEVDMAQVDFTVRAMRVTLHAAMWAALATLMVIYRWQKSSDSCSL